MNKRLLLLLGIMFFSVLTCSAMKKGRRHRKAKQEKQETEFWMTEEKSSKILNDIETKGTEELATDYFKIKKDKTVNDSDIKKLLTIIACGGIKLKEEQSVNSAVAKLTARTFIGEETVRITQKTPLSNEFLYHCTELSLSDFICERIIQLCYTRGIKGTLPDNFPLVVPNALCVFKNIQQLRIDSAAKIDTTVFQELPHLIDLRINHSQYSLASLIESLTKCAQLGILKLESNELKEIPSIISSLADLRELEYIGLNQNNLTTLPESISHLTNLTSLELVENPIATLPNSMTSMKKLNMIHMGKLTGENQYYNYMSAKRWQQSKPELFKSIQN